MTHYCLYHIEETHGFTSNKVLFTFHWFDIETLEQFETAVDPTYRNFNRCGWQHILSLENPWGVYSNLRQSRLRTRAGRGILDADTPPFFHESLTADEITTYVKMKQEQQQPKKQEIHRGLFELT